MTEPVTLAGLIYAQLEELAFPEVGIERKQRRAETQRRWRDRNREALNAKAAEYREKNSTVVKESSLRWRTANPDKLAVIQVSWRKDNPEKSRTYTKLYRLRNPEKVRESLKASGSVERAELREGYIKRQLKARGVPVSIETIALKRAVINFKRTKKELSNETI